jgi:PTH2 family peptidyl-tRNA hydrolase
MNVKQVIVVRKDLKMRRGKEIAQSCHASIAFLTRKIQGAAPLKPERHRSDSNLFAVDVSLEAKAWIDSNFAKICVRVNSEEELLDIHKKAQNLGLEVHLVQDSGLTEFGGVPTYTCLAIGPNKSEKIDEVTGELSLY